MARQRISLFALLAFVGLTAACEGPTTTATRSVLAPRASTSASGGYMLFTSDAAGDQTKTALIDEHGGSIRFQGSALIVPAGAVSAPTRFTFRLHTQPYMGADLSAVDLNGEAVVTFPLPLTLTISYARARTQIPDPSKIVMLWVENGVVLDQLPSTPDVQGKKVTAQVTHFSDYTPGVPADPDSPLQSGFQIW